MAEQKKVITGEAKLFVELLAAVMHGNSITQTSLTQNQWHDILELARIHSVLPLIFEKASENKSFLSLPEYQQLAFETMAIVAGQARRTEAFLFVYQELLKAEIHPIIMKGLVCRQIYGDYCDHRASGDEDILILKSEFEQTKVVLNKLGFVSECTELAEERLEDIQEISFYNAGQGLHIEVHINPIGCENAFHKKMNDYFKNVFNESITINVNGISVITMNATDHFLLLVLHAFKHFADTGLGIRQLLDILLFEQKFFSDINWNYIRRSLQQVRAERFFADVIAIGNRYLGFTLPSINKECCPDELLLDLLDSGVFGKATKEHEAAGSLIRASINNAPRQFQRLTAIINAIFPKKQWMLKAYPELHQSPWRLPICWVKRWGRFIAHNKANGRNLATESMKISKRRIELLKKYDIL